MADPKDPLSELFRGPPRVVLLYLTYLIDQFIPSDFRPLNIGKNFRAVSRDLPLNTWRNWSAKGRPVDATDQTEDLEAQRLKHALQQCIVFEAISTTKIRKPLCVDGVRRDVYTFADDDIEWLADKAVDA